MVLGAAFAGDLDALDFEFEFFLAVGPAADEGELVVGNAGAGDAFEHVVADGDLNAGVEDGEFVGVFGRAASGIGEAFGGFFAVGGEFGPVSVFESAQGGDVCFYAESFRRGLRDAFDDLLRGQIEEEVVELVALRFG